MNVDPLYQLIRERLSGDLDPGEFELCARSLLRKIWPRLVCIPGGRDSGMDGGIADEDGEPQPLICTIGEDPRRNLRRSLSSYGRHIGQRATAIFATPRSLTAPGVQSLHNEARSAGVTLLAVYEQEAFADLLYRDSSWRRRLLGLTGEAPALSVVPRSQRLLVGSTLVGRDGDLAWLEAADGDRLVLGFPGTGKTSLLHRLAKDGKGLFVVSADLARVADAVRDQQPSALFVDDAHADPPFLVALRHLRESIGADFTILADAWPGARDRLIEALALMPTQVRTIRLLTRDQILEVVKLVGVHGPDQLMREIIDQSEGRPGLAVTLTQFCLQGQVRDVALGSAISRDLLTNVERLVGERSSVILAAFAVGGSAGMPLAAVAQVLQLPIADLHVTVNGLAAAGVVREAGQDGIAVSPEGLRHALIRDHCFNGVSRLPYPDLMAAAPVRLQAVRALIGAKSVGARLPAGLLEQLLDPFGSAEAWREYAGLGRAEALYALERRPNLACDMAGPLLHYIPEHAIDSLLAAAMGDDRPQHQQPHHPLRIIREWIEGAEPGTGTAVPRRLLVARRVCEWLRTAPQHDIAAQAFASSLSVGYSYSRSDPGSGMHLTITRGLMTPDEIGRLTEVWTVIMGELSAFPPATLNRFTDAVWGLAYVGRGVSAPVPAEYQDVANAVAATVVRDLLALPQLGIGTRARLAEVCDRIGVAAPALDADVEILFPGRDAGEDWQSEKKLQEDRVRELASQWSVQAPAEVATRIAQLHAEADAAGIRSPNYIWLGCRTLASLVQDPGTWLSAMAGQELPAHMTEPFVWRVSRERPAAWRTLMSDCLQSELLSAAAVTAVLTLEPPDEELLELAYPMLERLPDAAASAAQTGAVPRDLMARMLADPNDVVATSAAIGLWLLGREIPASLRELWEGAASRCAPDQSWMTSIAEQYPAVGCSWLLRQFRSAEPAYCLSMTSEEVASQLGKEFRQRLIEELPPSLGHTELVAHLIGDDPALYGALLRRPDLKPLQLSVLGSCGDVALPQFMEAAREAGYAADEIAQAFLSSPKAWSGSQSDMWQKHVERYEKLAAAHEADAAVAVMLRRSASIAAEHRDRAKAREHEEDVYGR